MPRTTTQPTFATRHDAEVYIAERNLAGKKKAQHVLSRWYLVANDKGTVNRSLFTEMLRVHLKRQARAERWRPSELAMALAEVPYRAERLWRGLTPRRRKA